MLMKGAARCAAYRSYRDLPSKAFVNSIAMRTPQDPVFPDLAFGLPAPSRSARGQGPLVVAVGVMAYFGWAGEDDEAVYKLYIERLSDYVAWLLKAGHRVRFVIGKDKDVDAVADVRLRVKALAPEKAAGIEPFEAARNLHDVMRQMADADIAVVTRFHNLVCALRVGTPCVSLGYAGKNHALQEEMGLGRFSQEVETFDLEILKRHTEKLIAERVRHVAFIMRKVADYELQLKAQERILAEEFLAPAASVGVSAPARVNAQPLEHPVAH
jgi:polysaccharide pyruvyl transferase WcaK-like protein